MKACGVTVVSSPSPGEQDVSGLVQTRPFSCPPRCVRGFCSFLGLSLQAAVLLPRFCNAKIPLRCPVFHRLLPQVQIKFLFCF